MAKLREVVEQRPAMRQQDVSRAPAHHGTKPMALAPGALQGPPSRQGGSEGAAGGGAATATAPTRPPRNLCSADGVLSGYGAAGGVPHPSSASLSSASSMVLPPPGALYRSASHGASAAATFAAGALSTPGGSPYAHQAASLAGGGAFGHLAPLRPASLPGCDDEDRLSVRSFASASAVASVPNGRPGAAGGSTNGGSPAPLLRKSLAAAAPSQQQQPGRPLLPSMANNWVLSPSHTPPGAGGSPASPPVRPAGGLPPTAALGLALGPLGVAGTGAPGAVAARGPPLGPKGSRPLGAGPAPVL